MRATRDLRWPPIKTATEQRIAQLRPGRRPTRVRCQGVQLLRSLADRMGMRVRNPCRCYPKRTQRCDLRVEHCRHPHFAAHGFHAIAKQHKATTHAHALAPCELFDARATRRPLRLVHGHKHHLQATCKRTSHPTLSSAHAWGAAFRYSPLPGNQALGPLTHAPTKANLHATRGQHC